MASTIFIRVCAFILNRIPFLDAITLLFLAGELSQYRGLMKLTSIEIYAYATVTALAGAFLGFGTPRIRSICAKVYSVVLLFTCFGIYSRKTLHPAEHVAARSVASCIGAVATFLYYAALIDRSESTRLAMTAAQKQQNKAAAGAERANKDTSQKANENEESESESASESTEESDQKSDNKTEQAAPETQPTSQSETTSETRPAVKPASEPAVYTLSNIFIVIYCILNAYSFFYIAEQRHALTYHVRLLCPQLGPPLPEIIDLLPTALSVVYLCIGLLLGSDRRPTYCVTLLAIITVCAQCLVDCNFKYFHNRGGVPFWLHFRKLVDDGIVLISLLLRRRYA